MNKPPSTSVVVVSYRPGDWLAPCLASVVGQADEVIVVDNGSIESAATHIATAAGTRVVRVSGNLGFVRAANLGVSLSRGQVVALLNDDAEAGDGWLESAVATLDDPTVGAVVPKVLLAGAWREVRLADRPWWASGDARPLGRQLKSVTAGGRAVLAELLGPGVHALERGDGGIWRWTAGDAPFYVPISRPSDPVLVNGDPAPEGRVCHLLNSAGTYLRTDGYAGDIGVGSPDDGRWDAPADRFALSATAIAFRRSTWHHLGGLASPYFAYYEDTDWCWRAQLAGLRMRYEPSSSVIHRRSATSGGALEEWVRVLAESNRTLTLVRNAPRSVALSHLRMRLASGPDGGVRRRVARWLAWAALTRAGQISRRTVAPEAVWQRWAGIAVSWDDSPAR